MKRSALWSICGLALLISFLMGTESSAAPNWVTLDTKGNVRSFYGIPMTLTYSGLKRLHFKTRIGYRWPEGERETVYKIIARNNVEVHVTFGTRGKFYRVQTTSKNAVGPRGIRVGSTI